MANAEASQHMQEREELQTLLMDALDVRSSSRAPPPQKQEQIAVAQEASEQSVPAQPQRSKPPPPTTPPPLHIPQTPSFRPPAALRRGETSPAITSTKDSVSSDQLDSDTG